MKKAVLVLIFASIVSSSCIQAQETKNKAWYIKNSAIAGFLIGAGAWLAQRQFPRLIGTEIRFNSPLLTKVLASCFLGIGVVGAAAGLAHAYTLIQQVKEKEK